MKITAVDIYNREFKKGLRGYDVQSVEEFREEIAKGYETLYKENIALKEKVEMLNERVEHYINIETTIQNTLVLAQNASEQAKEIAQKESELMIKTANEASQKILDKAQKDIILVNADYEKVKQEFLMFRAKYKNFIQTFTYAFDEMEKDFVKSYRVTVDTNEKIESKEIQEETLEFTNEFTREFDMPVANEEEEQKETSEVDLDKIPEIKNFYTSK